MKKVIQDDLILKNADMKKQQAVFLYYDSEVKQISGWGRWKDNLSFGLNDAKMKAFLRRGLPKGSFLVVKSSLDEAEQYFEKIKETIFKIESK